ncbi:MAG: hypothetical protein IJR18_02390 [Campylobacter sp.]|nr:hypothetical protein [Campylobacter sp.]
MKTRILQLFTLCVVGLGFSGCVVSHGTHAHVSGGIYATSGDYYEDRYYRVPRERVVVVPRQKVVVVPQKRVVLIPQKRVVVARRPAVRPVVGVVPKHGTEVSSRRDMKPHHSFVRKDGKIPSRAKDRTFSSHQVKNQKVAPLKPHGGRETTKRYAKNLPPRPPHR